MQINDVQPSKTIGVVIPVGPSNNSFEIFVEEYRQSIAACSAAIETAIIFNNIPPSRVSQLRSLIPSNFREKDLGTCSHGISKARNAGIRLLSKDVDYILFLDDDDLLRSDVLNRLPSHLEDGLDIVVYGWHSKDKAAGRTKIFDLHRSGSFPAHKALADDLVNYLTIPRKMPYLGYVWGKVFSTKLITSNNLFFNENMSTNEDVLFLLQAMVSSNVISYVNQALVVYGFIEKEDADRASFAEHDINIASGFLEVARYLREVASSFREISEPRMHRLLTRYVGYIFYFSLLRCLKETDAGKLSRQYQNSMALITSIDDEFCQRQYFVVQATGESLLIGWLNKLRWFRLAFVVCLTKAFLERKYVK